MNILDIVKDLCAKSNITITELERKLNFSSSSIAKWDRNTPSIDKVKSVADYFNVSVDYLLQRTAVLTTADQILSDPDIIMIQRLRSNLSATDKKKMIDLIKIQFSEDFPKDEK